MRTALWLLLALPSSECCNVSEETTESTETSAQQSSTTTEPASSTGSETSTSTPTTTTTGDETTGTTGDETTGVGTTALGFCGDGVEDPGEECDGSAFCSPDCVRDRVVFVTSSEFSASTLGGADGADNADLACQTIAVKAGLKGPFKAWLSTQYVSPTTRFSPAPGRYARPDGVVVAQGWLDLLDGSLEAPIRITASGLDVQDVPVWTGTKADGNWSGASCGAWNGGDTSGTYGSSIRLDSRWSDLSISDSCATEQMALYCVEQGPSEDPCAPKKDLFDSALGLLCDELGLPVEACLTFIGADWCATCDALYNHCESLALENCPAVLGQCLQCIYAAGTCTQQAQCGLGDGQCIALRAS